MVVSTRRMTAGSGYRYLLRTVAAGDGNRSMSTPLTRYYTETGTPPGSWLGSGVANFGQGQLQPGMEVTADELALLIGMGRDPITGDQLGRAYPEYEKCAGRIKERVNALDPEMTLEDCAAETTRIEMDEKAAGPRKPVAGYDLTFSVPKSVSVLWAVADAATQQRIVDAHHATVTDVIDLFEREVAATRAGFANHNGAVAQVNVAGVAAVAYDHYDSRSADPQLHTHVVVSNKVLTVMDGKWRSLDGRPVFASNTALSAHYNALLADRLTRDLGVEWEQRARGADRNSQWEIAGIPEDLIKEFSSRSRDIDVEKDRLIDEYIATHGRRPSERTIVSLRAQATLATRPPKEIQSLAELTAAWRTRTGRVLGSDAGTLVRQSIDRPDTARSPGVLEDEDVQLLAKTVLLQVSEKRSTWTHWNVMAEASRQTMDHRFATVEARETAIHQITEAAEAHSIRLTPPELASSPPAFQRPDGTSVFRPKHAEKYTSQQILDAEDRLLHASERLGAPTASAAAVARASRRELSRSQQEALVAIATSGRQVDLLVGPAGAGKTTAMRALRHAWIFEHGPGSVSGLAPSAAAAQALANDLGIGCDNTAKWIHEHAQGNPDYQFRPNQLVILDEATLAGTHALDQLARIANDAGAKVLLVGDPYQLQSVDAGGAFSLLVDRRTSAPQLAMIHRFTHDWEKTASLRLRRSDTDVIATYAHQDRLRDGTTDQMVDAAYLAWRSDTINGRASVLIADSAHAVRNLNERARAERILLDQTTGPDGAREVELAGQVRASVGDLVITRRNDRTLTTANRCGWVKNGDRWLITAVRADGAIEVERTDRRRGGHAVLPAEYVAENVDLGYAITAHRAQGITVDTAHVMVSTSSSHGDVYVGMTRGREANIAYVALDQPDELHSPPDHQDLTAASVLYGILKHSHTDLSAHQMADDEAVAYGSVAQLVAEIETIAADAQRDRFSVLLQSAGLTDEQHRAVVSSPAFGPLVSALRFAEAQHVRLPDLLRRAVAQHHFDDADDIAAVLRSRLRVLGARSGRGASRPPDLAAGLFPRPRGEMTPADRQAIDERVNLVEHRVAAVVRDAINRHDVWVRRLRRICPSEVSAQEWENTLRTVAAYRDRYGITSDQPLGGTALNETQAGDRARAADQIRHARRAQQMVAGRGAPSDALPLLPQ